MHFIKANEILNFKRCSYGKIGMFLFRIRLEVKKKVLLILNK